jgi:hypothetical protein
LEVGVEILARVLLAPHPEMQSRAITIKMGLLYFTGPPTRIYDFERRKLTVTNLSSGMAFRVRGANQQL